MENIGKKISELRIKAGLSQTDLARLARVSQVQVSRIETGLIKNPHKSTIDLLLSALENKLNEIHAPSREKVHLDSDLVNQGLDALPTFIRWFKTLKEEEREFVYGGMGKWVNTAATNVQNTRKSA